MKNKSVITLDKAYKDIKDILEKARVKSFKAVNAAMVQAYWSIGRIIVKEEQKGKAKAGYGENLLINLAERLTKEFGKGFDYSNLKNMRQFYLEYRKSSKLQPLVGEVSWTKNLIIMSRCKEMLEREFYLRMTRRVGWSKNVLIHKIEICVYYPFFSSKGM